MSIGVHPDCPRICQDPECLGNVTNINPYRFVLDYLLILLIELDQWLVRHKSTDCVQSSEDVQDYPGCLRGLGIIAASGLSPPPEEEPFIAGLLKVVFLLDGFLVVPADLGQPAVNVIMYLGRGHSDLVCDGLLRGAGHLQVYHLGAPVFCRQLLAVIQSHDLLTF